MERHRGRSLMYRTPKIILNPEESPVLRQIRKNPHQSHFSVGKSLKNIRNNEKIANIKHRCLERSIDDNLQEKLNKHNSKNYSLADEDPQQTISDVMSDETDDAELQQQQWKGAILLKSKFRGRYPTIFFKYPSYCQRPDSESQTTYQGRLQKVDKIQLKYRLYGSQYKCIINAFQYNGYSKAEDSKSWDVFFDVRGSKVKQTFSSMSEGQRFNHFSGCWSLGRKDQLWRGIQKLRKIFPECYNFLPKTYIFPYDYDRFQNAREIASKDQLWIQKPVASSCGRNIKVISKETKVKKRRQILISEYISPPHLINGYKYDLRIYVLVTSFNPLKIYIYQEGLARFATQEYTTKVINKKYVHLTNFSVNKNSKNFVYNKNAPNLGQKQASKWSLSQLKEHYEILGVNYQHVFSQVQDIVIKTCISAESSMLAPKHRFEEKRNNGFELYGFDVLIDNKLRAWLMEVNVCPSLCSSSHFDRKIKHTLLVDLLNLIGVKSQPLKNLSDSPSKTIKKDEVRRFRFKNSHSIANLSYENCLEMLSAQDWLILFENEEQMDRVKSGSFKKAFPTKENILAYQHFFECTRYNNLVLWKNLLSPKNFLSRLHI